MLIITNFFSLFIVIFDVGVETGMVEGEIRLSLVFDSWVESTPYWSKNIDGSNIEKSRSYQPSWKFKCMSMLALYFGAVLDSCIKSKMPWFWQVFPFFFSFLFSQSMYVSWWRRIVIQNATRIKKFLL